jgi:hypothetical protein
VIDKQSVKQRPSQTNAGYKLRVTLQMSFRIDRLMCGQEVVILRVSGRIQAENLDTLRNALGRQNGRIVIDLEEVALVDREAVAFLALSEIDGIELRNCPAYIREWIDREKRSK